MADGGKAAKSKGNTRRNSQGRVERDKSGNPVVREVHVPRVGAAPPQMGTAYDKMGDAYTQSQRMTNAYNKMGDPRQVGNHGRNEFDPAYDMPGAIPDKYRR